MGLEALYRDDPAPRYTRTGSGNYREPQDLVQNGGLLLPRAALPKPIAYMLTEMHRCAVYDADATGTPTCKKGNVCRSKGKNGEMRLCAGNRSGMCIELTDIVVKPVTVQNWVDEGESWEYLDWSPTDECEPDAWISLP